MPMGYRLVGMPSVKGPIGVVGSIEHYIGTTGTMLSPSAKIEIDFGFDIAPRVVFLRARDRAGEPEKAVCSLLQSVQHYGGVFRDQGSRGGQDRMLGWGWGRGSVSVSA